MFLSLIYVLKSLWQFTYLSIVINSLYAAEVAMIDFSPIDLSHSDYKNKIDIDAMATLQTYSPNQNKMSLYARNELLRLELIALIDPEFYSGYLKWLTIASKKKIKQLNDQELSYYESFFPDDVLLHRERYRQQVISLRYLHGTHVAGVMMRGLKQTKFIHIPVRMPGADVDDYIFNSRLWREFERFRENMNSVFSEIQKSLKKSNVRVVNLSLNIDQDSYKSHYEYFASNAELNDYNYEMRKKAENQELVFRLEIKKLIENNPEILFILSAGNDAKKIDSSGEHKAAMRAENLIVVSSHSNTGEHSQFSNYSPEFVEISAVGEHVTSSLIGGGSVLLGGTSMAAPQVTRAFAMIYEKFPDFNLKTAKKYFFDHYAEFDPSLKSYVKDGAKLISCEYLLVKSG